MMTEQTKQNEVRTNQVKTNGTKPTEVKSVKDDPLFFEVPLPEGEYLQWLTDGMKNKRGMKVTAVSVRSSDGRLMVGVLPDGAQNG